MSSKKMLKFGAVAICVLITAAAFVLYEGFELTINPKQLEPGMNARLPISFRIKTSAQVQADEVGRGVTPQDCGELNAPRSPECRFENVFVHPMRQASNGFLAAFMQLILTFAGPELAIPVTLKRFGNVYMDSDGNIRATGYIQVGRFGNEAPIPVDITLRTRADTDTGVIELSSELSHTAEGYLEKWGEILTSHSLPIFGVPMKFSNHSLMFASYKPTFDESSHYILDLNNEVWFFSLLRPFLKDIELDTRGITLSYGL